MSAVQAAGSSQPAGAEVTTAEGPDLAPLPPVARERAPEAAPDLHDLAAERRAAARRAAAHRTGPGRRAVDFESLVGRYGTLALASLTILMGAGAFLSWAIAHGKIGPGLRVFLGALGAAALAVVGWRLRAKGSRRFGNTLLALALALVHVDAWGAGPYLGLVPSPVALGAAAAASVALAVLAWRGDEEALFSVGVGGAIVAPFVTSSNSGNATALLIYGYVVLATGLAALRGRAWRIAAGVAALGCWLYTATATGALGWRGGTFQRDYPALFAVAVAWAALVLTQGRWGARIARSAVVALLGVLAAQVVDRGPATDLLVLAALGAATAYVIAYVTTDADVGNTETSTRSAARHSLFTAAVLPVALGMVAVAAVPDVPTSRTIVALTWTAAAVAAAYLHLPARPTHLMVAGLASGAALLLALDGKPVASCVALSVHAAGLSLLLRRERTRLLGVPIALGLVILTSWTFRLLGYRPLYGYTPFLTRASLAALAMSAAWLVVSWNASRTELPDPRGGTADARTAVRLAGAAVTFLWGNAELGRAYSADVSTFLQVMYYAIVGVGAIFVGRHRTIPVLRHVGLALAIFAALKAIAEASSLQIGLRVGSYLLAGLFLLAVAYWYRDRDPEPKLGSG